MLILSLLVLLITFYGNIVNLQRVAAKEIRHIEETEKRHRYLDGETQQGTENQDPGGDGVTEEENQTQDSGDTEAQES